MYQIFRTSSFKKDYKKLSQKNKDLLREIIIKLSNNETLEENLILL
jgi:mRNA interferase YafQ